MPSSSWSVVQHGTLATLIETWKNILFYVLLLPDVFLHLNVIYFCLSSFAFVVQSHSSNNNSIKSRKIINFCWNIWNSVITSFSLRFLYIYSSFLQWMWLLCCCCYCWSSWCSLYLLTFLTFPYCWYWCRRSWSAVIVRLLLRILSS